MNENGKQLANIAGTVLEGTVSEVDRLEKKLLVRIAELEDEIANLRQYIRMSETIYR
jgi:hypothetical protein